MATELVQIENGFLIEVEESKPSNKPRPFSSGKDTRAIENRLSEAKEIIVKAVSNIIPAWDELAGKVKVESAEIEMGLGFEANGNIFIVQGKAKANLSIKLKISPNSGNN